MTYKHIKFQDSSTMRALEKLAQEKGLIKPEALHKKASMPVKPDLTPTSDLMDNILKLCGGLRAQGMDESAQELETYYLGYKQAQTLYETSKEKGEDVIQSAHPDGSHKLEDVEGDEAVVEDVLDKHRRILDVVNKKPTGKLSNASQLIGAVKVILGQSYADVKTNLNQAYANVFKAYQLARQAGGLSKAVLGWSAERINAMHVVVVKMPHDITSNDVEDVVDIINTLQRNWQPDLLHNVLPSFLTKGIEDDTVWNKVNGYLEAAKQEVSSVMETVKTLAMQMASGETPAEEDPGSGKYQMPEMTIQGDPLMGKLDNLINKLQAALSLRSISDNQQIAQWVNKEINTIKQEQDRISKIPADQRKEIESNLSQDIATYEQEVAQFYKEWVNVKPRQ